MFKQVKTTNKKQITDENMKGEETTTTSKETKEQTPDDK